MKSSDDLDIFWAVSEGLIHVQEDLLAARVEHSAVHAVAPPSMHLQAQEPQLLPDLKADRVCMRHIRAFLLAASWQLPYLHSAACWRQRHLLCYTC